MMILRNVGRKEGDNGWMDFSVISNDIEWIQIENSEWKERLLSFIYLFILIRTDLPLWYKIVLEKGSTSVRFTQPIHE